MNIKLLLFLDLLLGGAGLFLLDLFSLHKRNLPDNVDTIVIMKFLGNGSLTLAAPALYAIKMRYPEARIVLYTTANLKNHAQMLKLFDEIILLEPARPWKTCLQLFKLRRLFSASGTLIINLEYLSKTAIFLAGFFRGVFAISLSRRQHASLDQCIVPAQKKAAAMPEMYDSIAEKLNVTVDNAAYRTYLQKHYPVKMQKMFVFAPFCSNLSFRRMWSSENWSSLINIVCKKWPEYAVGIIGAPSDRNAAQQIINNSGRDERVHNYCGEMNFEQAALLIWQGCCFCGIDSAPLHLARLSTTPVVSLWGATDPRLLSRENCLSAEIVIFAKQSCTPCVHSRKKCPLPYGCVNTIPVNMVVSALEQALNKKIYGQNMLHP